MALAFSLIPNALSGPVGSAAWLTFWIMAYILFRKYRRNKKHGKR